MAACAGFALVYAVAPATGASASPYYQAPTHRIAANSVQTYKIDGGYVLVDMKHDSFKVYAPAATAVGAVAGSGGPTVPAGTAQAFAASLVAAHGWDNSQFGCLVNLWNRESGWNSKAANPSGAYGIPQALPGSKMGAGWNTDYRVQVRWGIGYIAARYGSPCGAWNSEITQGSY
jgi:hypothetical protein